MNASDLLCWQDRVRAGHEAPTLYYEELRGRYNEGAAVMLVMGKVPMLVTFDQCCYDAIMGAPGAREILHGLAGGLH